MKISFCPYDFLVKRFSRTEECLCFTLCTLPDISGGQRHWWDRELLHTYPQARCSDPSSVCLWSWIAQTEPSRVGFVSRAHPVWEQLHQNHHPDISTWVSAASETLLLLPLHGAAISNVINLFTCICYCFCTFISDFL